MFPLTIQSSSSSNTLSIEARRALSIKICRELEFHPPATLPDSSVQPQPTMTNPTTSPFLLLPHELQTKIFSLLFSNKETREIYSVHTFSPRSGQLLRVNKQLHASASSALYSMTHFEYSNLSLQHPEYLPAPQYRRLVHTLTLADPEYISFYLHEYPALRVLTLTVPRFLRLQHGVQAMTRLRMNQATDELAEKARERPGMDLAVKGLVYVLRNGEYETVRRRVVLKRAEVVTEAVRSGERFEVEPGP